MNGDDGEMKHVRFHIFEKSHSSINTNHARNVIIHFGNGTIDTSK